MAELKEEDLIVGAITKVLVLRPAQLPDGFKGQAEALYRVMKEYMVPWSQHKLVLEENEKLKGQFIKQGPLPVGQETALEQLLLDLNNTPEPLTSMQVEEAKKTFKTRYPKIRTTSEKETSDE